MANAAYRSPIFRLQDERQPRPPAPETRPPRRPRGLRPFRAGANRSRTAQALGPAVESIRRRQ